MRLLLAEDEKLMNEALVTILTHSSYTVDSVLNGKDALDYLETGVYDGAILDIMMPKVDGLTVLKTIRARGSTIPVLLLTAKSEIDDRVLGLDSGADDYLTKPFATKELLARVRAMLRRQPALQNPSLTFADIALDTGSGTLKGPSGEAKLAGKEYQILEMLLQNPHQIISTERFLDKLWGFDSTADQGVVWVNLSGLRKKLGAVGSRVQIRAARGMGYSLEEGV